MQTIQIKSIVSISTITPRCESDLNLLLWKSEENVASPTVNGPMFQIILLNVTTLWSRQKLVYELKLYVVSCVSGGLSKIYNAAPLR